MAGDLCFFIGIVVFWGLAHFQDAAVLMADRPLTYLQAEPLTDVNIDETHSLHREKEPKESRLKRQSGENNESNKIMETLTSLDNAIKKQIDERKRVDEEQGVIIDSLRMDLTELKGRLRDELTSNITSLQDGLELHVIEYENRTSEIIRLGEKLVNEESNCKKLAPIVSLLQEQMDDQHSANISHIETELEKLTRANENITSDIDDLREEFASRTADVRNNLTLAVGSLWERLDLKENTDGILVTNVTSLHERIELQEHTDDQLSSYLIRLQMRLNNQEYADTNLASNLSSMQRKIDQQEDTDTRLTSNMTRLNHQENKDTLITSNLTSLQAILASYLTGLQEKLTSDFASLLTRLERLENTVTKNTSCALLVPGNFTTNETPYSVQWPDNKRSEEPSDELVETTELDEAETTTSLVEVFFTKRPTTKAPRRTTKAPNRTTKAPKATKAPKLTTKAPKLTTKEPKLTTKTPKLTSKAPKLTTTLSPVTTEPPDTMMPPKTTKAPKATKPPKLTTKVPKLTTKAPKLTTKAPKLTTKKPKLTTKDPKLTTAPKLTTKEPKLTTKEPELTTKEPKKTTKAPKRTTKAPKQTDSPDMTTKTPKKTVKPLTTEGPETTKAPQTTPIPTTPRPLTIVSTMHKHRASSQTTTTESMTSQVTAPPTTRSWIVTTTRRKGLEVDVLYPPGPRPDLSAARPESVTLTVYRAVKDVYNVSKETMMETLHQERGAQISELKALGLKERLQQTEANWTSDLKRIEDKLRVIPICEATPRFQSSCYSVVKKRVTWRTANDECRSLGGKMAEIESAGERDHVKKIADASGLSELWLGGTDTENEGMWKWAGSGSAFSFTDWRKGEPNDAFGGEDCLTLVKADGWTWNDDNCDKELSSALCEFSSPF